MPRYLVVANQTLGGEELLEVCRRRITEEPTRFHLVVPLTPPEHYRSRGTPAAGAHPLVRGEREAGMVDTDPEARRQAVERLRRELERLRTLGAEVDGELGDPDPMEAVTHALKEERYDEIILSTLPSGPSHWLRLDLPSRLARHVDVPVTHVVSRS